MTKLIVAFRTFANIAYKQRNPNKKHYLVFHTLMKYHLPTVGFVTQTRMLEIVVNHITIT